MLVTGTEVEVYVRGRSAEFCWLQVQKLKSTYVDGVLSSVGDRYRS